MFNTTSPKVRKQILGLLTNRFAIGCLSILTLEQIVEASSTIWLVKLMTAISLGESFFIYLLLYLGSLALPYIPGCLAVILKTNWKQDAQRFFTNAFISANRNNIADWGNKGMKEEKLSMLTSEGPAALHALIDYVWDVSSYVLSVFFNILALSIVAEPLFAVSYSVSVICVFIIMKMNRRSQHQLTQKALIARVELCQSLLAAWDNVLLGNNYNFKLWNERTSQRLKRCLHKNLDLERFDQVLAIIVAFVTSIPSLLIVIYYMVVNRHDTAKLTAFVVILPILFMILSYTYQTLSLIFRWGMHKSKLASIYRVIQTSTNSHENLEKKVKWQKIMASHALAFEAETPDEKVSLAGPKPIESHIDLLSKANKAGRLTLRGENGCGKSTALMLLKKSLSDRAFFLPTHNQLSFSSETNKFSTGEALRKRLLEIIDKVDVDVLLLDEWDANLDKDNQEALSSLIDQLAKKKCVIEVRHR